MNKKGLALFILIICFVCVFAFAACKDKNGKPIDIDPNQGRTISGISVEYIDTSKFEFDSNENTTLTINYLTNKELVFALSDFKYKAIYSNETTEDIESSNIILTVKNAEGTEVTGPYLPGSYTLTFKFGDFEKTLNLVVNPIKISENVVTYRGIRLKYAYTGNEICPLPILYCGQTQLIKDVDYTLSYSNNIEKGDALICVKGIGIYSGEKLIPFEISTLYVEGLEFNDLVLSYNGQDRKSEFEKDLVANPIEGVSGLFYTYTKGSETQYEIKNAGTYNVAVTVVTEIGYVEVDPIFATITINPLNIEDCDMQDTSATYKAVAYDVDDFSSRAVKDSGNRDLYYSTDFDLSMGSGEGIDNINASTTTTHGRLIMQGKGNYYGTKVIDFQIERESLNHQSISIDFTDALNSFVYNGSAITRTYSSIEDERINYVLTTDDYTASYENNVNAGTASLILTGKGNFKDAYTYQYEIAKQEIDTTDFEPTLTSTPYNALDRKDDYYLTGSDARFDYLEVDYVFSIGNVATQDVIDAGTYTVNMTITVDAAYSNNYCVNISEKNKTFIIEKVKADVTATISPTGYDYTGSIITPNISVRWKGDEISNSQYQKIISLTEDGEAVSPINAGTYYIRLTSNNFTFDQSIYSYEINKIALPANAVKTWPTPIRDVWQTNIRLNSPVGGSITINDEPIDVEFSSTPIINEYSETTGLSISAVMTNYTTISTQVNLGSATVLNSLNIVVRVNGVQLDTNGMESLENLKMGDKLEIDVPQGYEIEYVAIGSSENYTNTVVGGETLSEFLGTASVEGAFLYETTFRLNLKDSNHNVIATSKDATISRAIFEHYDVYEGETKVLDELNVGYGSDITAGKTVTLAIRTDIPYTVSYLVITADHGNVPGPAADKAIEYTATSDDATLVINIYNEAGDTILQIVHEIK